VTDAPAAPPPRYEVRDIEASLGAPGWPLPGTLSVPKGAGKVPAVVLVHDVGPLDQDGAVDARRPFLDLARGLAPRGVAVLRYDKRTRAHGKRLAALEDLTVDDEVIDDALAAAAALRLRKDVDPARVYVLGHGVGGLLAPRVAEEDPLLTGLVLLAPAARSIARLVVDQTEYLMSLASAGQTQADADAKEILLAQLQHDAALTESDDLDEDEEPILGAPASYWIDLQGYDPVAATLALKPPRRVFVAQGGRDYQVTQADYGRWQKGLAGRARTHTKLYPALDHFFVAGEGKSTPDQYKHEGHVADELIADLAAWLTLPVGTA
jgi:dienelactone hydrolase